MSSVQSMFGQDVGVIRDRMRQRMATDNVFNVRVVMGHSFLDAPYHASLAQFMWDELNFPRQLVLGPRGGGKTVINCDTLTAKLCLYPWQTSLLTSYDLNTSKKTLNSIIENILNPKPGLIAELFPEIYKAVKYARENRASAEQKLNEQFLRIPAFARTQDPQIRAASLRSGITGGHYFRNNTDDLIDEGNSTSLAECVRAQNWFHTSFNVLEHQVESPWRIIGTHYNMFDPYVHILREVQEFTPFVQPGLIITFDETGQRKTSSYWESRFTVDHLYKMRRSMGAHRFAALIQQDPTQHEGATFQEAWLNYYTLETSPVSGEMQIERRISRTNPDTMRINLSDCTIFLAFDPALGTPSSTSRNAIVVIAVDSDENFYVLEAWAAKCTIETAIHQYIRILMMWQPDLAVSEDVLFQQLILPALKKNLRMHTSRHFNIQGVRPAGRSKDIRIFALQPLIEQGRLFVQGSQDELITEILQHPAGKYVDLLDALAYAREVAYVPTGGSLNTGRDPVLPFVVKKEAERDRGTDEVTGY